MSVTGDCWPTPTQELLLQGALLQGDSAATALATWCTRVTPQTLDAGSKRLLPLVAGRVPQEHEALAAFARSAYEQALTRQGLLDEVARDAGRRLNDAGIRPMLLKGMALVAREWVAPGRRAMADCDLLVRETDVLRARDVLGAAGWVCGGRLDARLLAVRHAVPVTSPSGAALDLHWHVLPECCLPGADDDFFERAVALQRDDVEFRTLCAADMLLHICVHGMSWSRLPPFRWVADALAVLRNSLEPVDWARLVQQADSRTLTLPLVHTLGYLQRVFDAPVPAWVVPALSAVALPPWADAEFRVKQRPRTLPRQCRFHWLTHRRFSNSGSVLLDLARLPGYARARWTRTRPRTAA